MTLLAQLSDPHLLRAGECLDGAVDTGALFARALCALSRWAPDGLLISGDLVDSGDPQQYRQLGRLLERVDYPVWLLPGNHDERQALRAWLESAPAQVQRPPAGPWLQQSAWLGPLRLLLLDTVCAGHPHGELCAARLDWLRTALEQQVRAPTLVALHHPPFDSGLAAMDAMALLHGRGELEALLRRHPQVERLLCGHLHRGAACRFGGTLALSAPSCAHQLALDFERGAAPAMVLEPPALWLHRWDGQRLLSHLQPLGDFGPARPY